MVETNANLHERASENSSLEKMRNSQAKQNKTQTKQSTQKELLARAKRNHKEQNQIPSDCRYWNHKNHNMK